jgi:Kef-type K+ transport system membrane component KefB
MVLPLLPLCCLGSGIKTNIGTINTWRYWGVVLFLIVLASVGKFTPACLTSKLLLRHRSWRFCSALGLMMNTRGLVELIALNIGLTMVRVHWFFGGGG